MLNFHDLWREGVKWEMPRCYSKMTLALSRFRLTRLATSAHVSDLLLNASGPLASLHNRVLEAGCQVDPEWKFGNWRVGGQVSWHWYVSPSVLVRMVQNVWMHGRLSYGFLFDGIGNRPQQTDVFFCAVSLGHQLAISNPVVSSLMLQIDNDFDVSVAGGTL